MRTNLLNNLSNVLKKGTSLSEKGTSLKMNPCPLRAIRYAAVLFMLFMVGIGNVWGTVQTYTLDNPSTDVHSSGSITIQGTYSTKKIDDSNQGVYINQNGSLIIFSKAQNIKGISFYGCGSSNSASGTEQLATIKTLSGTTFSTPASGFTATTDGNTLASLSNIAITKNQSSHTAISVSFTTAVSAVEIAKGSASNYCHIKKIVVTYDDAVSVPVLFSEGHFTSTTAGTATNSCSWGSFTLNATTQTVGGKTYYKRNDEGAILYNVPVGSAFAAGDVILIDFTGGDASKTVQINLTNGPSWTQKTATQTEHNFIYVIPAGSALVNATAFSFQIMNTDTYVYGVRVYKPVSNTKPSSVSIGDQWLTFVGESLTLTASLTGGSGDHTYQWYKGGTSDGYAIEGATSATYYKAEAEAGDADANYYCKVSTEGDDDVWSAAYKVQVLRLQLMWSDGKPVSDYTFHNFRSLGGNKATVSIPLEAQNYSYYIIDGFKACGNSATIQRSNYTTSLIHNVNNTRTQLQCDKAGTYIFTIDYSNYSMWEVSVGFPEDYYYKGNEDGWSSTHAMTVSCDGSYAYYWAKGKNNNGNNNNNFLITNSGGGTTYANGDNLSAGFNSTNITDMGKWESPNACIANDGDFYIIVYYPKTYINTTSSPKICASTTLPGTSTTAGEIVYFDNSESWSNVYYRIGHRGYNDAEAMTAVPGTARLYKFTTVAWGGYEAWSIANKEGWTGSNSIYKVNTGDSHAITKSTNYFKCEDDGNITILLDGVHNTESGCTYYDVTTSAGLLTHTATVGATTNGSIRLNWTDISNTAQSATSTTAGLAHTCNLQVTGVPNTGYEIATLTVNGAAFTSGNTHVLAADATIAATFSLVNYNVTYSSPSNGDYTIKVGSGTAGSETKTANHGNTITLAATPAEGYTFSAWTITNTSTSADVTSSVSLSDANNKDATFTMPAYGVTVTATFAAACSAPAAPTISGTTSYTYGGTITLTASHDGSDHDASTTYRWLKGESFAGAVQVQAAATGSSGYTFTKTAEMSDAGTYWCEASNGTGCESHNSSGYAITVAKASISPSLSYSSLSLITGDNSSSPTITGNTGSGSVTYAVTSATPSGCITVDSGTGVVTAVAEGTGTVTATIAVTDNYLGGTATATFTVSDPCFWATDLKKKKGGSDIAKDAEITASLLASGTITGGTLTNTTGSSLGHSEAEGIVFNSDDAEVTLALTGSHQLAAGSVITLKGISNSSTNAVGFTVGGQAMSEGNFTPASSTKTAFTRTYTVAAESALEGVTSFAIKRSTSEKVYLNSIKITGCGEVSCSAPTSAVISGGGAMYQYDAIELTASASGTDESTTYTWYRGNSGEDAAKAAGAIQATSTSGNTYSIASCGTSDAAVYYCVISNGTGCEVTASTSISVTARYYLTYDKNTTDDVSNMPDRELHTPDTYTLSSKVPTRAGYTFSCWNRNQAGTGDCFNAGASFTTGALDEMLYAKWTEVTHTVSVAAGDHGTVSPSSVTGVGIATASGNITATPSSGYSFSSWDLPSGVTAASTYSASSNPIHINATAGDKTITAQWSAINYTITYTLHDGDAGSVSGKTSYTIEDDDYDLPTPTWTGHSFLGWYATYSAGVYSDPVSVLASGSTGNKEYHAKWADAVTVNWTATEEAVSGKFYKGGSGHTILAEIDDASWDASGDYTKLELHASEGVILGTQTTSINGSGKAQVTASFDIGCDVEDDAITFTLTAPAAGTYAAIEDEHEEDLDACPGGGGSATIYSFTVSDDGDDVNVARSGGSVSLTTSNAFSSLSGGTATAVNINTSSGGPDKMVGKDNSERHIRFTSAQYQYVTIDVTQDLAKGDVIAFTGNGSAQVYITSSSTWSNSITTTTNSYTIPENSTLSGVSTIYIWGTSTSAKIKSFTITRPSGSGGVATSLTWSGSLADKATVNKDDTDEDFTYSATKSNNSLGVITYSSSDPTVATVNSVGKVHIVGDGTTTITATVSACGCYNSSSITYSLVVANTCADEPGTIVDADGKAIAGDAVSRGACETTTLKLTGYTGTTIQWQKDGANIVGATSATYTIPAGNAYSGVYSANISGACALATTNSITVTTAGGVNPTIFADEFTVKSGRPFHYRLMQMNKGESVTVKSATSWTENTDYVITTDDDNIVYISSTTYAGVTIAAAGTETITLTISNECGSSSDKEITIHKIEATAKPTVAWIATGDNKGADYLEAVKASESTNTALYKYLETDYTMTARNCYWSTNEADLVKEYSKYDLVILTDYPNSATCPSGKSGKSNSYTNAIGLLIDHRPLLTFEAFVAACPNWGIPSDPHNTKEVQNSMTLLCNADDIFGSGSPKFYAGADIEVASVGSGKQSLQGFAVNESPDFVYIGKITDDGKEYISCCERQVETGARMMVFGLNSNVMNNITNDGKEMVAGFVNYLLIMDPASIPDCSVIFDNNDGAGDGSWFTATNWEGGSLPNQYAAVRIDAPCVVADESTNDAAKAGYVKIHVSTAGSTYTGQLTIAHDGAMIVQKTITRVEDNLYTVHKPTQVGDIVIESASSGNGTLIFDNKSGNTKATVAMYSKGGKVDGKKRYQYIGTPHSDVSNAMSNYYGSWLYEWTGTGWSKIPTGAPVKPWTGYCISYPTTGHTYWMEGTLVATTKKDIAVGANQNMVIANSWTAPIDINSFKDADFENLAKNVYFFNTGVDASGTAGEAGTRYAASTYVTVPIHAAPYTWDNHIPSMQGFFVKSNGSAGTLHLDYDRHVRVTRDSYASDEMHAPKRRGVDINAPAVVKIMVSGENYDDRLVLLEREDFSTGIDYGWDGEKWDGNESALYIYTKDSEGTENSVSAIPELEGTVVGFRAGADEAYTLYFDYSNGWEQFYLFDTETQTYSEIVSGNAYYFTTSDKQKHERFVITRTNGQNSPTGLEGANGGVRAKKFIMNDKMYILVNGLLYDATGKHINSK